MFRLSDILKNYRLQGLADFFIKQALTRPLLTFAPFLFLGVILASYWGLEINQLYSWAAGLAAAGLVFVCWPRPKLTALFLALASFLIGWAGSTGVLTPPSSVTHVWHLIEPRQGESYPGLMIGGELRGPVNRTMGGYQLLVAAEEAFWLTDQGPLGYRLVSGLIRVNLPGPVPPDLWPGQKIRFPARLRPLSGFKNPGGHDYQKYWAGRGIWVGTWLKSPLLITGLEGGRHLGLVNGHRLKAARILEDNVMEPARGLLMAQLLGFRSSVVPEYEEAFRYLGLSHLLAVSGLHLGIWAGACFWLARRLLLIWPPLALKIRINPWAALLSIGPVLYYAALTGGAVSVKRAALMSLGALGALFLARRTDSLNILAGAAWVIVVIWPASLFTASFQLSFTACLAIVLALRADRLRRPDYKKGNGPPASKPSRWRDLVIVSLSAGLGTAPIVVYHFGHFPVAGLAANLVFTPLISLASIPPGLLAVFLTPWFPDLSAWLFRMIDWALSLLLPALAWLADKAGPGPMLPRPGPLFWLTFYGLALIGLTGPNRLVRMRRGLVLLAVIMVAGAASVAVRAFSPKALTVTVLDVGQGTAVHLRLPDGRRILVDAGGGAGGFDPGQALIKPYLLAQGARRLDVVALSHPQNDHLGGFQTLIGDFRPREFWSAPWPPTINPAYERFLQKLEAVGAMARDPGDLRRGFSMGAVKVKALWPPPDFGPEKTLTEKALNDNSLVLMIEFAGHRLLLPGDIEAIGEANLVELYGHRLKADVLVAPHHGSRTSLTPDFLAAVQPRWVVISAGRFNRFGFPHPEVLQRLARAGVKVWRTDRQGAFVLAWTARGRESAPEPPPPGLILEHFAN